jgi:hypothetical protein
VAQLADLRDDVKDLRRYIESGAVRNEAAAALVALELREKETWVRYCDACAASEAATVRYCLARSVEDFSGKDFSGKDFSGKDFLREDFSREGTGESWGDSR